MKTFWIFIITTILISIDANAQTLTQSIRGTIVDEDSQLPLIGATISLLESNPTIGTTTDENGHFKLTDINIGRVSIAISYLGYEQKIIPNIIVNSATEVVLDLSLVEQIENLQAVEIIANEEKGAANNSMSLVGSRSISAEQTNRYAGGFNDPSRILSNFTGVSNSQDGGNDIIVRGNSPKYIQWRLEGVQITNPNHFGDPSAVGGSVSTLNNNLLATSDFHLSAFAAEFGDALSGVYDVKFRNGNNEKFEGIFGFGILGTDITLEGPFKKGKPGSYLFNYRYSTAGLAADIGLIDVGGIPTFQDAAFKILLPTKNTGTFSLFGLAGLSKFKWEKVTPATWVTPGDNFQQPDIFEDYDKTAHLLNIGLNHTISLDKSSFLKSSILFSNEGIDDQIFESQFVNVLGEDNQTMVDSVIQKRLNFNNQFSKSSYRGAVTYHKKINAKNKLQVGIKYSLIDFKLDQSRLSGTGNSRTQLADTNEQFGTLRNYASWKHHFNKKTSMVAGIHNMNVLFNNKSTLEPRLAFKYAPNRSNNFHIGYGKHSNVESIHNYFAKVADQSGNISEPNHNLGLLKAHHFVAGYEHIFNKKTSLKLEAYYQHLYDLPVENSTSSYYSTINEGLEFQYVDLVNEGRGKNYGIELTLERYLKNGFYFLVNASVFSSKYTALDGIERNTQFNGDYLANLLLGKEFTNMGKKKNQTLSLNGKVFFGGGKRILSLMRDTNGNLAVDPTQGKFYDFENAYENKIEDLYLVVLSASYKWNKPNTTHEIFINLDNVTNFKGKLAEYYDENEINNIGYVQQFGFFPNVMYRLYF